MKADAPGLRDRRVAPGGASRSQRLPWVGLIGLVIMLMMAVTTADTARRRARSIGVDLEELELGLEVTAVDENGPADRAGLEPGDLIMRAGGREIVGLRDYDRAAATFISGSRVDFEIRRADQWQILRITPGRRFPWIRTILEWLACIGYLALGTMALVQLPQDLRARLLMLVSLSVALELAFPLELLDVPGYSAVALPVLALLVGFQLGTELHLVASIPDRRRFGPARHWLVPGFYAFGIGLGSLLAITLVADSAGWTWLPWSLEVMEVIFWDAGSALWAAGFVILLATAALRFTDPVARQQTLLVLLSGLPWATLILTMIASDQLGIEYPEWIEVVESLALLAFPVGVLVAVFRYQLFDLELVVKRGLVYTCLTSLLVLIFYGSIGAGGAFLSRFLPGGDTSIVLVGFATLLMGLLFSPLRRATQELIDRQFFPERTALREKLIGVASDLPACGSLPSMGRELVDQVCGMFGLESASVLLGAESGILSPLASAGLPSRAEERLLIPSSDPAVQALQRTGRPLPIGHLALKSPSLSDRLESVGAAILVPLMRRGEMIGVLILGRKLGGRPFPAEEVELLNLLSSHVATAFEYSQLYESATRDSLTGLLRRGAVLDALSRELDRARRFGRPMAVAMADVDRFKEVNDRFGHLKGDLILKRVSEAIVSGLRLTDQIGRYGGEEFLLVLPETDPQGVQVVAEKLRRLVERLSIEADNGEEIRVTISIGVAAVDLFPVGSRPEVNDLIAEADAALYRAKTGGRNRVEAYAATA